MFFLKYRASVPSVQDGIESEKLEQEVNNTLMAIEPELLQRRGWCSRILSIEEVTSEDVADRCSYTMNHCTDYKRWKFADEADFGCSGKDNTTCLTAGYCVWDGNECVKIQTSKSIDCLEQQENGQWETVCEKTHLKVYTGISIAIGSLLIFLLTLVRI